MRNAKHIMSIYRRHILSHKRMWSRPRKDNDDSKQPVKQRGARQLMYYHEFIDSYKKAKLAVIAGLEMVDA